MDEREKDGLIAGQELAKLGRVFGLALLLFANHFGADKGLVDLGVEVVPVGDDQEGEVAVDFAADFPDEHHHRIGFARTLRVPENT